MTGSAAMLMQTAAAHIMRKSAVARAKPRAVRSAMPEYSIVKLIRSRMPCQMKPCRVRVI